MSNIDELQFTSDPQAVLTAARGEGEVLIDCNDGSQFVLKLRRQPVSVRGRSPLDVGFVPGLKLSDDEIVSLVREGRERAAD